MMNRISKSTIAPKRILQEDVMFEMSSPSRGLRAVSAAAFGVALAALGSIALAAQDRYTLQVPNGLSFSEFRGYEKWQVVAASHSDGLVEGILAHPMMTDGDPAGFPAHRKQAPH